MLMMMISYLKSYNCEQMAIIKQKWLLKTIELLVLDRNT